MLRPNLEALKTFVDPSKQANLVKRLDEVEKKIDKLSKEEEELNSNMIKQHCKLEEVESAMRDTITVDTMNKIVDDFQDNINYLMSTTPRNNVMIDDLNDQLNDLKNKYDILAKELLKAKEIKEEVEIVDRKVKCLKLPVKNNK